MQWAHTVPVHGYFLDPGINPLLIRRASISTTQTPEEFGMFLNLSLGGHILTELARI